ncbi:hypothetical protein [Gynurincola endophyticus]|uniref:hypothetical protein n=1 Tax=Gynurincola endophyticus TaxID=2479004 RepID=UPI000F8CE0D9|nr:hypothetical protein [Gynurincola endophyticus]
MIFHLQLIGIICIFLSLVHFFFPKYFKWKDELSKLSLINHQMMIIHTFFIGLILFLMGILCITQGQPLINTELGKLITIGMAIFWSCRWLTQWFGYSKSLWKGKKFETTVHILFVILWTYFSAALWYIGLM